MKGPLFALLAFAATTASAQDVLRLPVTDPDQLLAMGRPAEATGIFRIEAPPHVPRPTETTSGAGAVPIAGDQNWLMLMGSEFTGTDDRFSRISTSFPAELACATGSTQSRARSRMPLPTDRRLLFLDVWTYDASATQDLTLELWEDCSPAYAAGEPVSTQIATFQTSGSAGYGAAYATLPAVYPNAFRCSYYLQADFGTGCPAGGNLRLSGARVLWGSAESL